MENLGTLLICLGFAAWGSWRLWTGRSTFFGWRADINKQGMGKCIALCLLLGTLVGLWRLIVWGNLLVARILMPSIDPGYLYHKRRMEEEQAEDDYRNGY